MNGSDSLENVSCRIDKNRKNELVQLQQQQHQQQHQRNNDNNSDEINDKIDDQDKDDDDDDDDLHYYLSHAFTTCRFYSPQVR